MKQLFMRKNLLNRASIVAEEVPAPRCGSGHVLIANRFSLISAGTETASVRRNVKDMVVKAVGSRELRDSVKEMLLKDGLAKTGDRIHYEMTKWTPLGYSGAGVAVAVGNDVEGIAAGDLVAYGGEGHAEHIRARKNLCVRVPEGVSAKEAAFVAVGSIALQAARRAEVQVGEVVAVLGLGLVGQLVSQILQAAGARVLGSDIIPQRLELARALGAEQAYHAGDNLAEEIQRYTGGVGVDRVVICAATSSSRIVEQAVAMARDRGRLVVVGMINLEVPCEEFYRKELDLVISRSYGPGRYDPQYEDHGRDYPLGYVRWTEQRNMQEFLRLVQAKKVRLGPLTSHEFEISDAAEAFETLLRRPEQCLAVLLRYSQTEEKPQALVPVGRGRMVRLPSRAAAGVAVVGCGGFARQFHLPNIKAHPDLHLRMVVASSGQSAKEMAARYGAETCATDFQQALDDPAVDTVVILTRDNAHAPQTAAALRAGKHVFCEKPLATSYEQCRELAAVPLESGPLCMVGFNRRFAPLVQRIKEVLDECRGPRMIHYRVNAGPLPRDHWVYDPVYAAGRVVGEVCHFVDLVTWLAGADLVDITAHAVGDTPSLCSMEDVTTTLAFADGSCATVLYTSAGSPAFPKERLEVFADGTAIALDDFRRLTVRGKRREDLRNRRADKGHDAELQHFARALLGEEPLQVTREDGIRATLCCLRILESVKSA